MIVDGERDAGIESFMWPARRADGSPLHAGVYFLRLSAGADEIARKIVIAPPR